MVYRGGPGELNPSRLCCPRDVPSAVTLPGCVTQPLLVAMGRSQGLGPRGVIEQEQQHLLPAVALRCRGLQEGSRLPLQPRGASRGRAAVWDVSLDGTIRTAPHHLGMAEQGEREEQGPKSGG